MMGEKKYKRKIDGRRGREKIMEEMRMEFD